MLLGYFTFSLHIAQSHRKVLLFTSSDLAWIPLSTCVYARWGGAGWGGLRSYGELQTYEWDPPLSLQVTHPYCPSWKFDSNLRQVLWRQNYWPPSTPHSPWELWNWPLNLSGFRSQRKLLLTYSFKTHEILFYVMDFDNENITVF